MYNLKKFRPIRFIITTFSVMVSNLVMLPIIFEIKTIWSIIVWLIVVTALSTLIDKAVNKALDKFIIGEIERHKKQHLREFFDYMENDPIFSKNVLREDIPIYDDERKKCGIQTVYGAISEKRWNYVNTL